MCVLGGATAAGPVEHWDRGIPLEQALKAADAAAGFRQGRPINYDVVTAKLIFSSHFRVSNYDLSEALEDMKSISPARQFWLIVYRRWPPRLDDDLVVFIDSKSGDTIRVFRWREGQK
jgi:hypothetical protein